MKRLGLLLALVLLGCERPETPAPASPAAGGAPGEPALIALNNRGVGEMGYFDYAAARDTFAGLVEQAPAWSDARINLAIATLNRQEPGDEDAALVILDGVLAEDPDNPRGHFIAGILLFNRGDVAAARDRFARAAELAPRDAHAAYYVGQCDLQLGAYPEAKASMERAVALDPYLRSAWYGAFLAEQRLGDREAARAQLEQYERLARNPRSHLAEIKYTRMGPLAEAIAVRATGAADPQSPAGRWDRSPWPAPAVLATAAPLAGTPLVDPDRSWLALPLPGGLLVVDAAGDPVDLPFAGDTAVVAVGWGDFDNDGRTDAYLGRRGEDQLWLNGPDGWRLLGPETGAALDGTASSVLVIDADHDGDLDVFIVRDDAPVELLANTGDGAFRPLAETAGLDDGGRGGRALAADLDGDRDLDLVVARDGQVPVIWLNDRLWAWTRTTGPATLTGRALVLADLEADGRTELCGLVGGAVTCHGYDLDGWTPAGDPIETAIAGELALADADGDGAWELIVAGDAQWQVVEPITGQALDAQAGRLLSIWNADPGEAPRYVLAVDGALTASQLTGPTFLAVSFTGREDEGASMRSNASGIGTRFVLRHGSLWTAGWLLPATSGRGSELQPAAIGTGGHAYADYVEIDWSDGVFQTELELAAGAAHRIPETQRQLASCPVLFGWDGEQHAFLSDVLGVGGIGFAIGPGEYAEPRPFESFRIDANRLAARNGVLELLLTEPMEETAYVDQVTLHAVDHPATLIMTLDERMATDGTTPTGEPLFLESVLAPVRARNDRGDEVLEELLATDLRAAPPGPRDPRFLGLLARPHVLTVEFDAPLDAFDRPILIFDGWVEYGYSQTSFAAWQAGIRYEPPTLEARGGDGQWRVVGASFGYPAGMPREAAMRLEALPAGTNALRLTTNQEIYFDRLAVGAAVAGSPTTHALPLADGRLERIGFPRRTDGPQRQPDYDFDVRDPFWDTRYQAGFYTSLGDASSLVTDRDNALAIVGPGDSLTMRFSVADLPPVPSGWRRSYVARFHGWAKDMDLFTRAGETVGPLPRDPTVAVDRSDRLHARYNQRYQAGR
ncbi:MAG: FG-GAP-like repeat-containing protein [Pseudomonadota bacterium]